MDKYHNSTVRRQDRLLDKDRAAELLRDGEYGFLALGGLQGGYGIPLNFVWEDDYVYFHCAPEGEKLRRIAENDLATFCVVGGTRPEPSKFTTAYESVMVFGHIERIEETSARMGALALLSAKYSPYYTDTGRKYAEKSLPRTAILRLRIERISGKCKKLSET